MEVDEMEAFSNARIIIVDDDESICQNLVDLISSWGLSAEGFTQPEAALSRIQENSCDIILLDVFISDTCGLDLIPQIDCNSQGIKIIVISGYADKDTAIRALKLGAFDLLEKPFQNDLLRHSILRALRSLQNEREFKRLIDDLKQSRSELLAHKQRLENLNSQLRDTNRALSIFAQNIEREREEVEKRIALKLRNLIIPIVDKLRKDRNLCRYEGQLDMLVMQIEDLTSGFAMDSRIAAVLSFTELRIASLIKNGVTTEEIARQLHISESTVRTHRKNIRKKLKINNVQYSLRNFLNSKT
ncbi:MAG: response regulator [Syntrophobacteraceae bacterium]